ncbi:MAG: hypothetical protein HQ541_01210, partial [Mariniphaga sp.]|nr:hypothetical protein [Mariniphaga sp.]
KVELKVALVEESQLYSESIDCWKDIEGIDFSSMREEAIKACYLSNLKSSNLLSNPSTFINVDFEDKKQLFLKNKKKIKILRKGIIHGIALWFEASLSSDVMLSSSPLSRTHWKQCFAPLSMPINANKCDNVFVNIDIQLRTKGNNSFNFTFSIDKEI